MKLSLAVIAKDETDHIKRIIKDYEEYFDELVFLIDLPKTIEALHPLASDKVKFYHYERSTKEKQVKHIFFDRKRNELTKLLTGDYYVRLDTDDKLIHPENVRLVADKAKDQGINIVYCWYEYAKDQYGNVHAAHYRETIVNNTTDLHWNKRIHENLIPSETSTHKYVTEDSIVIEHMIDYEHAIEAGKRNLKYLVEEYMEDKEETDPRTLAYLGRMMMGSGDHDKAQFFLEKHIEKSGWDEDRYMSWCMLAEIMSKRGDYKDAEGCCFEAVAERPDFPDAYFKLHSVYADQGKWKESIHWAKVGFQLPIPKTFMLVDPASYGWRPMLSLAYVYLQNNQPVEAWELFQEVKKKCPGLESIQKNEYLFKDAVDRKDFTDHFLWLYNYIRVKESTKLMKLFDAIPSSMDDHKGLISLKQSIMPPKIWGDKSIVFYCGTTIASWADPSVLKGVGGSEEAVIYISREFVKLGYDVTVYCQCDKLEGEYNGVKYLNHYKINPNDTFNIFFAWRANIFKGSNIKAKKKYVWIHDFPQANQFDKGKQSFDKVLMLSEYHKSLLPPTVAEDQIYVTTNGINLEDFEGLDNLIRQKHRIIYASSYDRGLEKILDHWPEIRKSVDDAELHIFYGWNTFKDLIALRSDGVGQEYIDRMEKLMDQPGIFDHGRVGHKELLKEYARSAIFAYPCNFAGEINCIALTKAIACGCMAVTNDYAVLKERNPHIVAPNDKFCEALIAVLKGNVSLTRPPVDIENYKKYHSWGTIAETWERDLIK